VQVHVAALRHYGATALDLAWVAAAEMRDAASDQAIR
jgi:fructose-1,6-bisphosphatase/inositol monophosphatase family enzyme